MTINLKLWAQIRADSRWSCIDAVENTNAATAAALIDLVADDGHRSIDVRGLLATMREPLFLVLLFIVHGLLGPIEVLNDQLKGKLACIPNSTDSPLYSEQCLLIMLMHDHQIYQ
jgi:hypothetical protein